MTAERATTPTYAPMPELGTTQTCVFCRRAVRLNRTWHGWHLWTAPGDPLDGRWHCDGGTGPGTVHMPALHTLHIPVPPSDRAPYAARYDADGVGHHPQS